MRRVRTCLVAAVAMGMVITTVRTTAVRADDTITLMVGGMEKLIYLPVKLTEQLGYFKDEGLDVELLNEPSGVDAEDEMLAGAVQGVVGFYDHTIDLQSKGKFTEVLVQFSQAPGEVELVSAKHPEIKSIADFKGHDLGVTGLGSSTNFLSMALCVRSGLKLGEFTSVPVEAGDTFIAALQQDKIQAGMTTEPTVTRLLKTGQARVLVDLRTVAGTRAVLGGTYPAAAFYMQTSWIEGHRDTAQKLVNALVRGLAYIHSHSAEEIAAHMPPDYYVGDRDGYIRALAVGKGMFTSDGMMPEGGPQTVLAVLASFKRELQGNQIDLSKTYDMSFIKHAAAGSPPP